MARRLRLESEDGCYHVINRGNYRAHIFREAKTKVAFLKCLGETCERTGWRVHAWCLMSNHYHLAITTPRANLVEGMGWFQGTFATRFNRWRSEHGHLYQGRYKSIVLDPMESLGPACHYIHLNPVRAHLCDVPALRSYAWTSVAWILEPSLRATWFDPESCLRDAGHLPDTLEGREKYLQYLRWLAEDEPAQKRLRFEQMSREWIVGGAEFTKAIVKEQRELVGQGPQIAHEIRAARAAVWAEALDRLLAAAGRSRADVADSSKSVPWKLAIASRLKAETTVTNRWLGQNLFMGNLHEVSRKVAAWDRRQPDNGPR